jgi:hypothetical protein
MVFSRNLLTKVTCFVYGCFFFFFFFFFPNINLPNTRKGSLVVQTIRLSVLLWSHARYFFASLGPPTISVRPRPMVAKINSEDKIWLISFDEDMTKSSLKPTQCTIQHGLIITYYIRYCQ